MIRTRPASSIFRWTLFVAAVVVMLKLALLSIDPHVRFFFGDSASYIHASLFPWAPPDRSPTYPLLIRYTAVATGSLQTLLLVQTAIGIGLCLVVFRVLAGPLRVAPAIAAAAAIVLAIEPMQLFYERSVMAETTGTACFIAMIGCACFYLRDGRWPWLIALAVFGIAAVSLRMSLLPVVLVLSTLTPLVWLLVQRLQRPPTSTWLAHLLLAIIATVGLHQAYMHWNGHRQRAEPAYIIDEPWFRLGWLAPLVEPVHLQRLGLDAALLDNLVADHRDRRSREAQIWNERGLIAVVREAGGENASRIATKIGKRLLRERPLAVIGLGWATLMDHFDGDYARGRMANDLGISNSPPAGFVARIADEFGHDASDWTHADGVAHRAYAGSRLMYTACAFIAIPLALAMIWLAWRRRDPALALLALACLGFITAYILFSHILVFRYLHPLLPIMIMLLAVAIDRARRSGAPN